MAITPPARDRSAVTVKATAPIRVCDNGGWTDTWFAKRGAVFSIAVHPCAEVQVRVMDDGPPGVVLHAEDFGDRYSVAPQPAPWGPHALLEAAIAHMSLPTDLGIEVAVHSDVPTGAGTGTSAAVTVALLGALDALSPGRMTPDEIARAAHAVETKGLGRQSGIQDQIAAARGGVNYIEMAEYPNAVVSPIHVSDPLGQELERRLVLVYLGRSHDSSAIHEHVIRELESVGPDCRALEDLRRAAAQSRDALAAGNLAELGRAMIANTDAQGRLNPALVGTEASRAIAIGRELGVAGWKVNGAGGDGGSVTLLCNELASSRDELVAAVLGASPASREIPIRLSRTGLHVRTWDSAAATTGD